MSKVRALVLERQHELTLRDIDLPQEVGPGEVKIKIHTVGVCGSDVHYYTHGRIGPFVVKRRWCWATRPPAPSSKSARASRISRSATASAWSQAFPIPIRKASRLGMYNIDPGGHASGRRRRSMAC